MSRIAAWIFIIWAAYATPSIAAEISQANATAIALREAGCRKAEDCVVRGGPKDGKWVFVIWFVMGRNADGSPQFSPGGWVGLTLNAQGEVIDRMLGANQRFNDGRTARAAARRLTQRVRRAWRVTL